MNMAGHLVSMLQVIFMLTFFTESRLLERSYPQDKSRPGTIRPEEVEGKVLDRIERAGKLVQARLYDEAIAEYKAALVVAGRPVFTIFMNMGYAYYEKGDYGEAADSYKQAVAIKPDEWSAHYSLAESLFAAGEYGEAETEYRRVLAMGVDTFTSARTNNYLGLSLYKQNRIEEAIARYSIALERRNGQYSEAHNNMGIALMERKDYKAAEREFRLAIEQERTFAEAHFNLATSFEHQQRFREAVEEYEAYLKLNPDAEGTEKLRAHIELLKGRK